MLTLTRDRTPSPVFDLLAPLRWWLNNTQVQDARTAHLICSAIPCTCPFEKTFTILGRTYHIPPLCKLNPLYNEVIALRFRALSYLADDCGVDVTRYVC